MSVLLHLSACICKSVSGHLLSACMHIFLCPSAFFYRYCLYVCLSVCLPISTFTSAYVCVFVCGAISCPSVCLHVFLSACFYLPFCFICMYLFGSVCVCLCSICDVLERSASSTWGQSVSTGHFRAVVSFHGCRGQNHRCWWSEGGNFQRGKTFLVLYLLIYIVPLMYCSWQCISLS